MFQSPGLGVFGAKGFYLRGLTFGIVAMPSRRLLACTSLAKWKVGVTVNSICSLFYWGHSLSLHGSVRTL